MYKRQVDTWFQVTGKGVIPEVGGDGEPTTSFIPIWSFQDVGSNAAGGEIMYIDEVSLKIEAPAAADPLQITGFEIDMIRTRFAFHGTRS